MSIIVTLTSTSKRLSTLRFTLISLFEQSLPPDQVVLCLSKQPYLYDEGILNLPNWLSELERKNSVKIMWVENIGPYRKLIPIYKEASLDDLIITCDDDVIYGPNWLSTLVVSAMEHPDKIICGRAKKPLTNKLGKLQSYSNWPMANPREHGFNLLPIGVAGIVYRKNLLSSKVMQSQEFLNLAPKQDDLWFNLARIMANTEVYVSPESNKYVYEISAPSALSNTNNAAFKHNWNTPFKAIIERTKFRAKSYIGYPVSENDYALIKLKEFKDKFNF